MPLSWMASDSARASPLVSYWIIVPESGTDDVVAALRASWLSGLPPSQVHYCVANNTASRDPMLHILPILRARDTPNTREEFFADGRLVDSVRREQYNSFLRRKVHAMMISMSALAVQVGLRFCCMCTPSCSFLLDAVAWPHTAFHHAAQHTPVRSASSTTACSLTPTPRSISRMWSA